MKERNELEGYGEGMQGPLEHARATFAKLALYEYSFSLPNVPSILAFTHPGLLAGRLAISN